MSTKKNETIQEKLEQLEELMRWFESEEITVEEALKKYEQALTLSKDLEDQLLKAKNQVEIIKKKFSQ